MDTECLSIYLHLLNYFNNICSFKCIRILPSWLNLFLTFLLFQKFCFLNFLFSFHLVFILWPLSILLNLLILISFFFCRLLEFSIHRTYNLKYRVLFSYQIFLFNFHLHSLARTSSAMLNTSVESRHTCLILKGKDFSFSLLSTLCCCFLLFFFF